jgi:hypothetical protein
MMADSLAIVDEDRSLKFYEDVIERGRQTFIEVGNALMTIREQRLYREQGYETFEEYSQTRWGWTARHANRLMDAAEVVRQIGPIGPIPATESQARELAKLPDPETRREVWQATVEKHGENVTAAKVRTEVEAVLPPRPATPLGRAAEHYLHTAKPVTPAAEEPKPLLSETVVPESILNRPKPEMPEEEARFRKTFHALLALTDVNPEQWAEEIVARGSMEQVETRMMSVGPWVERLQAALAKHRAQPLRAVK